MRASDLVPASLLRAVDSARTRRFLAVTGPATEEFVRREGLKVKHGPFAGMDYLEGEERTSGDLVAKLVGTYEQELHPVIEAWVSGQPEMFIDVGSAEGYYAVGMARAVPGATVYAFEMDDAARGRCAQLAELNGVGERVVMLGECTAESLAELPAGRAVLLSDCEGAELVVLDPQRTPALARWPMLVELHDFIDPSISAEIARRFEPTHEVEIIGGRERSAAGLQELSFMGRRQLQAVLSERRPGPMQWARLTPRSAE